MCGWARDDRPATCRATPRPPDGRGHWTHALSLSGDDPERLPLRPEAPGPGPTCLTQTDNWVLAIPGGLNQSINRPSSYPDPFEGGTSRMAIPLDLDLAHSCLAVAGRLDVNDLRNVPQPLWQLGDGGLEMRGLDMGLASFPIVGGFDQGSYVRVLGASIPIETDVPRFRPGRYRELLYEGEPFVRILRLHWGVDDDEDHRGSSQARSVRTSARLRSGRCPPCPDRRQSFHSRNGSSGGDRGRSPRQ